MPPVNERPIFSFPSFLLTDSSVLFPDKPTENDNTECTVTYADADPELPQPQLIFGPNESYRS